MKTENHFLNQFTKKGAKQFCLDSSVKFHFSSAVHNTTMAVNAIRAVAKK